MKNERQEKIIKLVVEKEIKTQEMLCEELQKAGYRVTQATVSRDIKELALIKIPDAEGGSKYAVPALKRGSISESDGLLFSIIAESVKDVDYAVNTVVVKCASGMAQAICAKLDSTDLYNAVGTLAGDDTIFVLMRTEKDAARLVKEFSQIIGKCK